MMNRFSKLIQLIKRQCSWYSGSRRSSTSRYERRRLFLEPLQPREVLAVAIDAFMPTSSGFVAELSAEIRQSALNLYDTESQALGAADVTLTGSTTGNVRGSLVVEGTTLTFIATGGALPTDTYTATLRSASNGIVDQALGELLDGEFSGTFPSGNGTPGGDFTFTFSVAANPLVVSLPDFARGPEQSINVPAMGSGVALPAGLPIQLSDANGVSSLTVRINYNPDLLTITGAELGADAPSGSQVQANVTVPGEITVAFFALDPMSSGAADLINLIATVPETATYGAAQVVDITFLEVNAGELQATADDALHVVAYPGDANANRRYDAEDARLIARTGIGLDSGFVTSTPTTTSTANLLYPTVDAVIIGDVTGVDGLSPLDASDVLRVVVGLPTPNIPALPTAQAPTALSLSATTIAENQPSGTLVGTFTTTDPDAGDTHAYTLVSGTGSTNNGLFTISGSTLRTAAAFDNATPRTLNVRVRTTDSTNRSLEKTFAITVTSVNVAPTAIAISSNSVAENSALNTSVGTLTSTDPDANNTHTYTLVSGTGATDNASFSIAGDQLQVATTLDFETTASYTVRVRTTDQGGLTFEQAFTINVTDVNEAPTVLALSGMTVDENVGAGTAVGTFTTSDADANDTHTYTFVAGPGDADNASFTIDGDQLKTADEFDFETRDSYSIRVQSTDALGLTMEATFTITVNNVNEAPTALVVNSSNTITEAAVVGTVVATLTTQDPDLGGTHTYSLVAGSGDADNASFMVVGDELQVAAMLDFDTQASYSVRVQSTDQGGLSVTDTLTIAITGVNEAPTVIAIDDTTVAESEPVGTLVGLLTSNDPDAGDTHTYTLVAGNGDDDNASFTISGDQLLTNEVFNQATKGSYTIRVESTDAGGLTFEQVLVITITEANVAPTAVALDNSAVAENANLGTLVGTLSTTDANATDTHTYSFAAGVGDTDNALFTINGDQLSTAEVFDFETQDTYSIRVQSTDRFGLSVEEILTITITDANDAPTSLMLSGATVAEDATIGTVVGTFTTVDVDSGDTHTYGLVAGDGDADNDSFEIVGDALQTLVTLDFETKATYSIRVQSTDQGGLTVEQMLTITVTNVNEVPTLVTIDRASVAEAEPVGTLVGLLTTTDPDAGDTHTYSFVAGPGDDDNASFSINGDELQTNAVFDHATKDTYSVRVQSLDAGGLSVEQVLTITITEANEAPTALALDNTSINENVPVGTAVGTFSTTDANTTDTFTYTLVAGAGDTDNASFTIDGENLLTAASLDFEAQDSYSIRVQTTDPFGLSFVQTLTITVNNLNEAPTELTLGTDTIAEDAAIGATVGTLSTTDVDAGDTHTYSLVAGDGDADNLSFTIDGNELKTAVALDFETLETYSIRVQSTDAGGLTVERMLTITVTNVNEEPTQVALSNSTIEEGQSIGTAVGLLASTDPDSGDTHTYSLVAGSGDTDNGSFTIVGDELQSAEVFDLATKDTYSIRVQSTDAGGLTVQQILTITIIEVNVAPTALALDITSVDENVVVGTSVGTFSTTDANASDTHSYTLVAGAGDTDNASFTIDGDQLLTAASLDFETQDTYSIRVRSTDPFGLMVEDVLTITVNDLNEAPTAISSDNDTVAEDATIGSMVGVLSTTDPDSGNAHSYSLVAGDGDSDNGSFTIVGDELRTSAAFDFETKATYSVRVQSTDQSGLTVEQILTVSVTNVNEEPTAIALDSMSIAEGEPIGTLVGALTSTDPDSGDTHTYSLVVGNGDDDNASFTINGDQLLTNEVFVHATKASYSIRVQSTDAGGLMVEEVLTITITEVNVAPTAAALDNSTIDENVATGTAVGTLSSTDANASDTHSYTLVAGAGDTDNASFTIAGDQLLTAAAIDFETQGTYSIRVQSMDQGGLTVEQVLTITVNDLNEAPTAMALDNDTVAEDAAIGAAVGMLTTTDPDTANTHTYSLVAGEGDTDNAAFTISGDQLLTGVALDFETQQTYTVRVRSTDQGGEFFEQMFTIFITDVAD